MAILKDTAAQPTENSNACDNPEDVHKKEKLVATEHTESGSDEDCVEKLQTTEWCHFKKFPPEIYTP